MRRRRIAGCTFLVLYLELQLIRWLGAEMKLFSYFKNFVLMAAFAGLGLGCLRPERSEGRRMWLPWCVLALVLVCVSAHTFGLSLLFFPDAGIVQWNGSLASPRLREALERIATSLPLGPSPDALLPFVVGAILIIVYGILGLVAATFYGLGRLLAAAFEGERPLVAYSADIVGSLAGSLLAALGSWFEAPPVVWITVASVVLIALMPPGRRVTAAVALSLAVAAAGYRHMTVPGSYWSPYYHITLSPRPPLRIGDIERSPGGAIDVNHSPFQDFEDLSPEALEAYRASYPPEEVAVLEGIRTRHELPFRLGSALGQVLVLGAGTGNDVAAGLRLGAGKIDAVDIDPTILDIGRHKHPERPYDSPRVTMITDDARAVLGRLAGEPRYDLVVFGTLDSHAAVNALSSLRLEYFVYTVQSFRSALSVLKPDGLLVVAFATGWKHWVTERMVRTLTVASGEPVRVLKLQREPDRSFFIAGPLAARLDWPRLAREHDFVDETATYAAVSIRPATDNWPYLYMDPERLPWVLLGCVALNVALASLALHRLAGKGDPPGPGGRAYAWQMFFMGAGFLLIETKAITEVSLALGATWRVNAVVFGTLLVLILLANLWVLRRPGSDGRLAFGCLLGALLLKWALDPTLAAFAPTPIGRFVTPIISCGPAVFASVIFARLFSASEKSARALGANVVGAVLGGGLEVLAIFTGIRTLELVALTIYATAFVLHVRTLRARAGTPVAVAAVSA
jgi:spermidine synthase